MGETKATKANWCVSPDMVEHGCCWDSAISVKVEKGEGMYGGDRDLVAECSSEHSNLIAAAPELLEALKAVISENHVDGAFDMARAAIAKAEGKA